MSQPEDLRCLLDHVRDGIVVVDTAGKVRYANMASETILGNGRGGLEGSDFGIALNGDGTATVRVPGAENEFAEMRAVSIEWDGAPSFFVTLRDVTETRRTEAALRESEARFQDFAYGVADRMWETDVDHRFTYVSPLPDRRPPEMFLGRYRWDPPEALPEDEGWERLRADMVARRAFRAHRFRWRRDDGSLRHLEINGKPIFDEAGDFQGYRGNTLDVTAEVVAKERAAAAEEKLSAAVEALSESFRLFDAEDRQVIANKAWRETNSAVADRIEPGMTFEEILRLQIDAGLIVEAEGRVEEWFAERVERHRDPTGPFEVARQDGRWLLVNDQRLPDGGVISIATDITAMKRTEGALRESEARFKDFAFSSSDRLWETDAEHRFTYISELDGGLPPEAFLGRYRWDSPGGPPPGMMAGSGCGPTWSRGAPSRDVESARGAAARSVMSRWEADRSSTRPAIFSATVEPRSMSRRRSRRKSRWHWPKRSSLPRSRRCPRVSDCSMPRTVSWSPTGRGARRTGRLPTSSDPT